MKKKLSTPKGFTLIELIVVMCVIAILAFILIPNLAVFRERSATATCQANQRILNSIDALWCMMDSAHVPGTAVIDDGVPGSNTFVGLGLIDTAPFCPTDSGGYTCNPITHKWECNDATGAGH